MATNPLPRHFESGKRSSTIELNSCPLCQQPHLYSRQDLRGDPSGGWVVQFLHCPNKNEDFQVHALAGDTITLGDASVMAPNSRVLFETGRAMMLESLTVQRDFSKIMLTSSMTAIPASLGVIKWFLPDPVYALQRLLIALPPGLFIAAAVLFAVSLLPHRGGKMDVDVLEAIVKIRGEGISFRQKRNLLGFVCFVVGAAATVAVAALLR